MSDMQKLLSSLSEKQKVALTKLLQADLSEELKEPPKEPPAEPAGAEPSVGEDFIIRNRNVNQNRRRSKVKAGKNQWVDNGEFKDVDTPLPEDFEKPPRRKAAPKKTPVECHMCGKTFKQDSRYSYGDFPRCNKCTGR